MLTDLQGNKLGRFFSQVCADKRSKSAIQRVDLVAVIGRLIIEVVDRAADRVEFFAERVLSILDSSGYCDERRDGGSATKLCRGEAKGSNERGTTESGNTIGRAAFIACHRHPAKGSGAASQAADQCLAVLVGVLDERLSLRWPALMCIAVRDLGGHCLAPYYRKI